MLLFFFRINLVVATSALLRVLATDKRPRLHLQARDSQGQHNGCTEVLLDFQTIHHRLGRRTARYPNTGPPRTFLEPDVALEDQVDSNEYRYYELCIAHHVHEHQVEIHLDSTPDPGGELNMYISPTNPRPTKSNGAAWIFHFPKTRARIPTYLPDFPHTSPHSPLRLFIGVYGKPQSSKVKTTKYRLKAAIVDLVDHPEDVADRRQYYAPERQRLQRFRHTSETLMLKHPVEYQAQGGDQGDL